MVSRTLPDTIHTVDGETISLNEDAPLFLLLASNQHGAYRHFWQEVAGLADNLSKTNFVILMEGPLPWVRIWKKRYGIPFPVVADTTGQLTNSLRPMSGMTLIHMTKNKMVVSRISVQSTTDIESYIQRQAVRWLNTVTLQREAREEGRELEQNEGGSVGRQRGTD